MAILNQLLPKAVQMSMSFQHFTSLIPNVKHLRVFNNAAFVLLAIKFDNFFARLLPFNFIGYDTHSKTYCVYDVVNEKMYITINKNVHHYKRKI